MSHSTEGAPRNEPSGSVPKDAAADPMTASLMARLFGVPMLIISVIVGCAVVVVLLFGSITTDRERSLDTLVSIIERGGGEKTAGVLLPNDKELWQAAGELAGRLRKRDVELSGTDVSMVVDRLAAVLRRDRSVGNLSDMGHKKVCFVIEALGRTGSSAAGEPLAEALQDADADIRRGALAALGELSREADVRSALPGMLALLDDPDSVVRVTVCVALSAVAEAGDAEVLDGLSRAYLDEDREVRWNAALSLARLGSDRGKSLLLDMLSRDYWEQEVKVRTQTKSGAINEYAMPPGVVARYLEFSVEAARNLSDDEIQQKIAHLVNDPAAAVKNAARTALELDGAA